LTDEYQEPERAHQHQMSDPGLTLHHEHHHPASCQHTPLYKTTLTIKNLCSFMQQATAVKKKPTSNCKIVETIAVFPVISDILLVNTHLPPSPLINVVMDLVMTFKATSKNIERGRGIRNVFQISKCFQECIF